MSKRKSNRKLRVSEDLWVNKIITMKALFFTLAILISGIISAQKANQNKDVILKINGNKIEANGSSLKIADLKNAKVELICNGKPVGISKYSVEYSSNGINIVGKNRAHGTPQDLSTFKWADDIRNKQLNSGSIMTLKLYYLVDTSDSDQGKSKTWKIILE